MVPAKTTLEQQWAGLSLCQVLRKGDLQSTDRRTLEKFQVMTTIVYTGGKIPLSLPSRSGNEWLVGEEGYLAELKASVGDKPSAPPATGWKFFNNDTKAYEDDQHLTCHSSTSSPCSVTVSLSSLAKEIQGECEGKYKNTGLRSMGRQVINNPI